MVLVEGALLAIPKDLSKRLASCIVLRDSIEHGRRCCHG